MRKCFINELIITLLAGSWIPNDIDESPLNQLRAEK
jgi:hypothetical protein